MPLQLETTGLRASWGVLGKVHTESLKKLGSGVPDHGSSGHTDAEQCCLAMLPGIASVFPTYRTVPPILRADIPPLSYCSE